MFKVYECVVGDHDLRLVLLAAGLCLLATSTAVRLLSRLSTRRRRGHFVWLAIAAGVVGAGVWATHFIAMLAFQPNLTIGYDLQHTAVSLVLAVVLIGGALQVSVSPRLAHAPMIGGALLGLAVGAMHYVGMQAFHVQGVLLWDRGMVAASLIIGMALGAMALVVARHGRDWRHAVGATACLTVAICGLHFTGMSAVAILPDATVDLPANILSRDLIALGVATIVALLLAASLLTVLFERRQKVVQERHLRELANAAVEGLIVCDEGQIVTVNLSLQRMLGLRARQLLGRRMTDLFEAREGEDPLDLNVNGRREGFIRAADHKPIPVEVLVHAMGDPDHMRVGVAVRDLRDREAAAARIRFLAHNDDLTGLLNRARFTERLEAEFQRHARRGDGFAVLCLDLDRFKQVNDVFGHAAGDTVLKAVGERISAVLGDRDVLARLGGDEFAILRLEACRPADLAELSEKILRAVAPEIDLGGGTALIGVSIGIALFPQDGDTPEVLMRNADAALYHAKADGRGRYRFFEPQIGAALRDRQIMEFDLRHALSRQEMIVVYQPQTSLKTGETFGFEALLRWNSAARGPVTPSEFIPVAEDSGLILPIGEWVLRQACAEAATWSNPLQIAVNLSAVQLRSADLSTLVHQVLIDTGLPPSRLELEITETALVEDFQCALHSLRQIKALGVKVAMDDFGTGYSSLSNLRAFPFDKIKIDQSFIRNVDSNPEAATIVRAIVGLGQGLNLTVLAEGVETREELAFLEEQHCVEVQGYLFGRPADISQFEEFTSQSVALPRPKQLKA